MSFRSPRPPSWRREALRKRRFRCSGDGHENEMEAPAVSPPSIALPRSGVSRFALWLLRKLLDAMGGPPIAVELWEGTELLPEGGVAPRARLRIRDAETLVRLLAWPDLHFGEAFESGRIEVQGDLDAL